MKKTDDFNENKMWTPFCDFKKKVCSKLGLQTQCGDEHLPKT